MKFVSRKDWGARPADHTTAGTASKVAIHWEGPLIAIKSHDECAGKIRGIQAFHMDVSPEHFADIAYNAVVCPHGFVFEGRGKGVQTGANGTTAANQSHLAICFLGGETDDQKTRDPFTDAAKDGINDAAEFLGVTDAKWAIHRDFVGTRCPGPDIADWVAKGHPRANGEEDEMTQDEKNKLGFVAQVLSEMKTFYGRFDPEGKGDFFRGMEEAARLIKKGAE